MKESLRDKTRDELAQSLNGLGISAVLSERKQIEEKAENSWYQRSLGVIDIEDGPIDWINILKKDRSKDSPPKWWIILGIPDERLTSSLRDIKIKTVRKKSFPLFGKVVDVTWKGKDGGTGLTRVLSQDQEVKALAHRIGNLEVKSQADDWFQGWTLIVDRRFQPTTEDWETIRKIAERLASAPLRL